MKKFCERESNLIVENFVVGKVPKWVKLETLWNLLICLNVMTLRSGTLFNASAQNNNVGYLYFTR